MWSLGIRRIARYPFNHMKTKKVVVVDYNPKWKEVFNDLKTVITNRLGDLIIAVEHVGSTSVEGLAAKPVIDLDIVIENRKLLPEIKKRLAELGYFHEGDLGLKGREAFGRKTDDVPKDGSGRKWMTHHLYVVDKNCVELKKHRAFRDFLKDNPKYIKRYGELKNELAKKYPEDIESYMKEKDPFIKEIMGKAFE